MNGEFRKLFCPRDFFLGTTFSVLLKLREEVRTPEKFHRSGLITQIVLKQFLVKSSSFIHVHTLKHIVVIIVPVIVIVAIIVVIEVIVDIHDGINSQ